MDVVLNKWGNSLGLRIPRELVETFKFRPGSRINISTSNSKITLEPSYSVEALFESHYGKPMASISREEIGAYTETDWGSDVGGELID